MTIEPEARASTVLKMQLRARPSQQGKPSVTPTDVFRIQRSRSFLFSTVLIESGVKATKATNIDLNKADFQAQIGGDKIQSQLLTDGSRACKWTHHLSDIRMSPID